MIASLLALVLGPAEKRSAAALDKARAQLGDATKERERLEQETMAAAGTFHTKGDDRSADALQRLERRVERAKRLEQEAVTAVSVAEQEARVAAAEACAQNTVAALAAAEADDRGTAAALAETAAEVVKALGKVSLAITRSSTSRAVRGERYAAADQAVKELALLDHARAATLRETLTASARIVASRPETSARALVLARLAAELGRVVLTADGRVRALVDEQARAARLVGAQVMPAGAGVALIERERIKEPHGDEWIKEPHGDEWINRWLLLTTGVIPVALPSPPREPGSAIRSSWPGITGENLDGSERLAARARALDIVLTQAGEHEGADDALAAYLAETADVRDARLRAQQEQAMRAAEAQRAQGARRPIDITPRTGPRRPEALFPGGEEVIEIPPFAPAGPPPEAA